MVVMPLIPATQKAEEERLLVWDQETSLGNQPLLNFKKKKVYI